MQVGIVYDYSISGQVSLDQICNSVSGLAIVFLRLFYLMYGLQQPIHWFPLLTTNDGLDLVAKGIETCRMRNVKVFLDLENRGQPMLRQADIYQLGSLLIKHVQEHQIKLDGINLVPRDSRHGYHQLATILSQRHQGASPLKIAVTPQCIFPDGYSGPAHPNTILEDGASNLVDLVVIEMFGSGGACHYGHPDAFWNSIDQWQTWHIATQQKKLKSFNQTITLGISLPASPGLPGDFIPADIRNNLILTQLAEKSLPLLVYAGPLNIDYINDQSTVPETRRYYTNSIRAQPDMIENSGADIPTTLLADPNCKIYQHVCLAILLQSIILLW